MSVPVSVQALAELERRARARDGNRVGVLSRHFSGTGWGWKGSIISDAEAAQLRRTFRGQLVIVNRSPALMSADACFSVSA